MCKSYVYILTMHVCPHRWLSVLRWWKSLPSRKPVAEGVPGRYLHLHMLWWTAGTTHQPLWHTVRYLYWNEMCSNVRLCMFGFIRAGDVRIAADQVLMSMPVCCSLLDMETTHYARWVFKGFLSRAQNFSTYFFGFNSINWIIQKLFVVLLNLILYL